MRNACDDILLNLSLANRIFPYESLTFSSYLWTSSVRAKYFLRDVRIILIYRLCMLAKRGKFEILANNLNFLSVLEINIFLVGYDNRRNKINALMPNYGAGEASSAVLQASMIRSLYWASLLVLMICQLSRLVRYVGI